MRPVSATTMKTNAEKARTWTAEMSKKFCVAVQPTMDPSVLDWARMATAISDSSRGASAKAETMASRLAPMPAKLLPLSSAPSISTKREKASR